MDRFNCHLNNRALLETIFVLRIIRIFRIFHLVKHYRALKILIHAIRASVQVRGGEGRGGEGRAGLGRAGQGWAGQGRAGTHT